MSRALLLGLVLAAAAAVAPPAAAAPAWLAGDLHVHSCFSHDVYCGPDDDNTGPEEFYTFGEGVQQRFLEAAARGLDYLAITDHEDTRSAADPGFGAFGVIGVPGYEASLDGHAQILGARAVLDEGDSSATAVAALAATLRERGGAFQINHPGYRAEQPFAGCDDTAALNWGYGYLVRPDTIEVLNPTSPAGTAEAYLDCWLERGARVAVTGGSDNHWLSLSAVGIGFPTTWVLARRPRARAILRALRRGRTAVSALPPAYGGAPLLLEADRDGDGAYESLQGARVPGGTAMRVRSASAAATGLVDVRANGATVIAGAPLPPGGAVAFDAPASAGWVRARLSAVPAEAASLPGCEPNGESVSTCLADRLLLGLTSPVYLR